MAFVCASPFAHQFGSVLSPTGIVRERLRGRIRTLREEIAVSRILSSLKPLERRYSVIEKHPDLSQTILGQSFAVSGNQKNERLSLYKQRLSSISTNKKRKIQSKQKILKCKRHQLTGFAPNYIVSNPRGQR